MNVGTFDRVVRVIVGLALLSLPFFVGGWGGWLGLIGIFPLGTGVFALCPAYSVLGISTCRGRPEPGAS